MSRIRDRKWIFGNLIGVLLLLGACGDDNESDTPTPTSPPAPTATQMPTDTPRPTDTPQPTVTPQPTDTVAPSPTATATPENRLDIAVCAPDAGPFSTTIDHPFYFLPVGTQWVLEGEEEDDGELLEVRVEITSLDETEVVAGVTTRVIEEREFEDGELVEVSRNFVALNPEGTVCYFGEDVDDYEDGEIVSHEGAWRAGENGNQPGILLPANPMVGQVFQQEAAPGIAEDEAEIIAAGETIEVPFGTFTDTIRLAELDPLDDEVDEKVYGRGVGLLVDEELERIDGDNRLDIAVCAPDAGPFSTTIDHPFYFLPVGTQWVLEGEEDDGEVLQVRVEITSLAETEVVAGVTTRVIEEREFEDGELVEVSRNFVALNPEGTVCYFGEDVDDYEDGEIVSHEGAWRAGENGNQPGILLPANPMVGQVFQQEAAPGIAEDEAEIIAAGETVEVPFGTFTDTIRLEERNPLEGDSGEKVYGRDVGLLVDEELERIDGGGE